MSARPGPSIRRLLLGVNAFILLVPVLAVVLLGIYETNLVQQTERGLIAESVLIGEAWRDRLLEAQGRRPADAPGVLPDDAVSGRYHVIHPEIDLSEDAILPPEPPPTRMAEDLEGPEWRAGAALKPMLDRAKLFNLSAVRVLDADGCVVATTGSQLGACLDHLPEVQAALAGRYAAVGRQRISDEPAPPLTSISRRGEIRVFTATPVFADGRVVGVVRLSRTSTDAVEALWAARRPLLAALLGCVLLTLGISVFFARAITRPVRAITAAAQAIARGEPRTPLQPGGVVPAEVFALSAALDQMTAQLESRARYVADFAANVSHELKTPLTAVRGAAELLRESWAEMDDAQRERFLSNIDAAAQRMERLVTRLLYLARIENTRVEVEPILLESWLRTFVSTYPLVQLTLDPSSPATLKISPEHLESVLGNLLDNAVRHGAGQAIDVTVRGLDGRVEFAVRDRGPGVSEKNQARLFERFFTTERDRGGTGLGLAIVQAIAHARGGHVAFESGPGGTTFRVAL